ncbi:MAG: ABC transporter substrate-binding protein [Lachnospiraceae bacterium]|nr:ABC transporter substrate-binding protein [Lachnospiraceae bacterium]
MKKLRKALCLTLAAVLMTGTLTACGNTDSGTGGNSAASDTDSTESSVSSDAGVFKIGGIGPLTGGAASYGISVKNGAQIAVDEINAAGGIGGARVEFNMQDDELDAEKAVNAYNALKDWGMNILMGTVTSGCGVAVAALSSEDNMFQLTPSGSSVDVIKDNTNVFQVCFTDPNQGIGSADYIGQIGVAANDGDMVSRVAIIYDSSDVYSTGIYEKFVEASSSQPYEIVSVEAFTESSKTDFSVQLQKAKDSGAQLVFLPIYYQEASLILSQAVSMDYNPVFFGCDGLDGILGVEDFDTSLAEGLILLTPFAADAEDALTKAFVAEYQKRFNEIPNQFAADAYDAIYIIKDAIERSGATPDMSISAMGDALIGAITQISYNGLTGNDMTWEVTGEVNKAPKAMIIVNGVYQGL